jgi:hypothetical protein
LKVFIRLPLARTTMADNANRIPRTYAAFERQKLAISAVMAKMLNPG